MLIIEEFRGQTSDSFENLRSDDFNTLFSLHSIIAFDFNRKKRNCREEKKENSIFQIKSDVRKVCYII